ncbi:MAG: fluoride efflux transporter CrcB [Devosia sp.]
MLMYLYIAIGGAIGSVARGWMSLTVAEATGPEFPWGTILINILGSFLIGALTTGTAADGRFPLSGDLRSLLMVGICGGFTTFSSFSLQSLELLRQGRVGWALLNIGASIVLCLGSVAAGYYSVGALRPSTVQVVGASGQEMGERVVAVLDEPETAHIVLAASARLAELAGGGQIQALAIQSRPVTIMPTEEVETREDEARSKQDATARSAEIKFELDRWMPKAVEQGLGVEWLDVAGNASEAIKQYGRRSDVVVVAARDGSSQQDLHSALYRSGTSVLVMPPGYSGSFGINIAIAWRDDDLARAAVLASLPLLRKARNVYLLSATPDERPEALPAVLIHNDIAATIIPVEDHDGETGKNLLAAAHDAGADMIVMGAFAHGEWREALLGGVTRFMLSNADMPLLMRHTA